MRGLFSMPLGDCSLKGSYLKRDPISSFINGIFGMAQAGQQSEANLSSAIMQRQWQAQDWDKQTAFAKYLLEEEQNWNSGANQKKQLQDAGVNPSLAMYGGQGSVGSSLHPIGSPAAQNPPSLNPVTYQGPIIDGLGVSMEKAADLFLQGYKDINDVSLERQHQMNETLDILSKLDSRQIDNERLKATTNQILQDIAWNRETWKSRQDAIEIANQQIAANTSYTKSLNEYQLVVNKYAPDVQKALLSNYAATYDQLVSAAALNDAQALNSAADAALKNVNKETQDELRPWLVDKAKHDANNAYWQSERSGRNYILGDKIGSQTPAGSFSDGGQSWSSPNAQRDKNMHRGSYQRHDDDPLPVRHRRK